MCFWLLFYCQGCYPVGCESVVLCHNHPSGFLIESPQDKKADKHLKKLLSVVGIELKSSIILSGLNDGYFIIDGEKINSLFVFESFTALRSLVDRKDELNLEVFPLIEEYKTICKKLEKYNSKKALSIQKEFLLTSLVFYLFEKFPDNFQKVIVENKLTHIDFIHGF